MKTKKASSAFQSVKKKNSYLRLLTPFGENIDRDHILEEYPRPQMVRNSFINLNGCWQYAITDLPVMSPEVFFDSVCTIKASENAKHSDFHNRKGIPKVKEPRHYDGFILVPFSPETLLSGVMRKLKPDRLLWYHRVFDIKDIPSGKRLCLNFGAVDQVCRVYVNGQKVAEHSGGYLAFSADITKSLVIGSNNLTVCVRDVSDTFWIGRGKQALKPGGMFYTAQSGIWQTVWMEWVPDVYIKRLKITPLFDENAIEVTVFTSSPAEVLIKAGEHGTLGSISGQSDQKLKIPLNESLPWTPEHPVLIPLAISTEYDHIDSYTAMRKFSVVKDEDGIPRLALNNKPYFQNGVLDQGYWSDGLYTAASDEAMIYDIQTMKNLGFNMIRKHLKIEPLRWYYHCDRLGMIVWQDILNGGGRSLMTFMLYLPTSLPFWFSHFSDHVYPLFSRASAEGRRYWLMECKATMELLYNCPCIALWTAFNEGWGQFDAIKNSEIMKTWDPDRLVDHASGWYDQGGGDIASYHTYFGKLCVKPEKRPYCFTEYGGYSFRVEGHSSCKNDFSYKKYPDLAELRKAFRKLQQEIKGLEKKGLAAAVYTQVSDVEEEINGILTFDRRVNKII